MTRICDDRGCRSDGAGMSANQPPGLPADAEDPRIVRLKEAAQKEPKAAFDLGLRYFRGDGVRQDSYQALVWMREAAERGNLAAQKALGGFYLFGLEEMGPDPAEAEKWLSIAVSRGDKESAKLLAQARADKQSAQDDYAWRHWRDVYYGYWSSGYRYYGVWQTTVWYWY